nr:DNA (cytosine-5)-methyltransferase 1-like [Ipomoea trifida]
MVGAFETVLGNNTHKKELCLTEDCLDFHPSNVTKSLDDWATDIAIPAKQENPRKKRTHSGTVNPRLTSHIKGFTTKLSTFSTLVLPILRSPRMETKVSSKMTRIRCQKQCNMPVCVSGYAFFTRTAQP